MFGKNTCLSRALCVTNYTAQKSKFDLHSIKISSVGTWPATYILHRVGNIPTAFSGDPVKQLSFTACPESHQIWAIPDWEETDSCAWEPLEDPLPAALSPLMRRSQLVGPYWLQMWHFGRRRGWTCRQTSARLPVTALPPPSPGLWCLLWGVLLHGHQGLSPASAPGSRWCKAQLHLVLNLTKRQKCGKQKLGRKGEITACSAVTDGWKLMGSLLLYHCQAGGQLPPKFGVLVVNDKCSPFVQQPEVSY